MKSSSYHLAPFKPQLLLPSFKLIGFRYRLVKLHSRFKIYRYFKALFYHPELDSNTLLQEHIGLLVIWRLLHGQLLTVRFNALRFLEGEVDLDALAQYLLIRRIVGATGDWKKFLDFQPQGDLRLPQNSNFPLRILHLPKDELLRLDPLMVPVRFLFDILPQSPYWWLVFKPSIKELFPLLI